MLGTQISLPNGDVKNIEDIVVGDLVIGWNANLLILSEVISDKPQTYRWFIIFLISVNN